MVRRSTELDSRAQFERYAGARADLLVGELFDARSGAHVVTISRSATKVRRVQQREGEVES